MKKWYDVPGMMYDKDAKSRVFSPGDKALVFFFQYLDTHFRQGTMGPIK